LDDGFSRFFSGQNGYPRPRRKFDNDSCRFPDPIQFRVEKQKLFLPKLGYVKAVIHRPIQGQMKSITVCREGSQWYASVVVKVRVKACPLREAHEGAYDIGVTQPVVEADGTKHAMVRTTLQHISLEKRIQRDIARGVKGSRRNKKNKARLRNLQALQARRRRDSAHKVSAKITKKYTHIGAENLKLKNMTASAKGTIDQPGKNVAQKSGLNRAILDVAPGQLRRMIAYKAEWNGGVLTCVNPQYTSQYCSECTRHPKDDVKTKTIPHGRITRDTFVCPLCRYTADADVNAARNILALARPEWRNAEERFQRAELHQKQVEVTNAAGTAVSARRALWEKRNVSQENRRFSQQGDKIKQELFNQARKKIDVPSGLPEKTYGFPAT
jgi:putative transposase